MSVKISGEAPSRQGRELAMRPEANRQVWKELRMRRQVGGGSSTSQGPVGLWEALLCLCVRSVEGSERGGGLI